MDPECPPLVINGKKPTSPRFSILPVGLDNTFHFLRTTKGNLLHFAEPVKSWAYLGFGNKNGVHPMILLSCEKII